MSINRAIVSGNLTRDPELRRTQGGMEILQFGMAVNDRRKNPQTGDWEDYPNYLNINVFGNRAGSLSGILRKGMKVTVEGKLRWSQWQTKDGQKRDRLEIIADEVELPPRTQQAQAQGGYQSVQQPQQQQQATYQQQQPNGGYTAPQPSQYNAAQGLYDEDIPF